LTENISLKGKVVGILEKGSTLMARIACSTCFVNISIKKTPDIRLNDQITIDARLIIDKVSQDVSEKNETDFEFN